MKSWMRRGLGAAFVTVPVAIISGFVRPLLGVGFFVTACAALVINGSRATLAAMPMRLADADDPASPPAIARVLQSMIRGHTILLGAMSVVFAIAAVRTTDPAVRVFAASFAVAAFAAGPGTSLHRRMGLQAAAIAVVSGVALRLLQRR